MPPVTLKTPRVRIVLERPDTQDWAELIVQTDNRDMVRWDRYRVTKRWPEVKDAPMLWLTFLAWSAMVRTGETAERYEDFEGRCVQVANVDADDQDVDLAEDPDGIAEADPTRPAAEPDF